MPVEITVGPPQLVINQGDTILVTDNDGQIPWPSGKGLYFLDTRLISSWNIFANGAPFELLNSGAITHYAARVYLKSKHIIRRGRITTEWSADTAQLRITYRNKDFAREVNIRIANNDAHAVYANGRLSFEIDFAPGASWHSCILYELGDGKVRVEAPKDCIEYCGQSPLGMKAADWKRRVLKIRTTNEEFYRLFDQAVDDMAALRLPFEGTDHLQFVPVAGVPWFARMSRPSALTFTDTDTEISLERFLNKIKHYRAVATRYDKTPDNFLAGVKLASLRIWMRFNESMT